MVKENFGDAPDRKGGSFKKAKENKQGPCFLLFKFYILFITRFRMNVIRKKSVLLIMQNIFAPGKKL